MILIFISWIYISFTTINLGVGFDKLMKLKNNNLVIISILGLFSATILASIWSIFGRINIEFHAFLLFLNIMLMLKFKNQIIEVLHGTDQMNFIVLVLFISLIGSMWLFPVGTFAFGIIFLLFSLAVAIYSIFKKHKEAENPRAKIAKDVSILVITLLLIIFLGGLAGMFANYYVSLKFGAIAGLVAAIGTYAGQLVAAGLFGNPDGDAHSLVVRTLGHWQPLGPTWDGYYPYPTSLCEYHGDLIAGGSFDHIGQMLANNIARWDGAAWHSLGAGVNSQVYSVIQFGEHLIAAWFIGGGRGGVTGRLRRCDEASVVQDEACAPARKRVARAAKI